MPTLGDIGKNLTTNPFRKGDDAFGNINFQGQDGYSFGSILGGIQGIANGINSYFNGGKPENLEAFDLSKFRSSFNNDKVKDKEYGSIAKTTYFNMMVNLPNKISSGENANKLLIHRIDAVNLPSKNISTVPLKIYGPVRNIATGVMYDKITTSIICSSSLQERDIFISWMESIQPVESSKFHSVHDGNVTYYNDYISHVSINVYDADGVQRSTINLHEAYPISVSDVQMNWSDIGSIMRLNVTWNFRSFSEEYHQAGTGPEDKSLLGMIRGFANDIRDTVNSIKNLRFQFKQAKSSISDLRKALKKGSSSGNLLDRVSNTATGISDLASGLSDSAFRLLDSSNGNSVGGVGNKISNLKTWF